MEVYVCFLMYIIISTHVKSEVTDVYVACVIMYIHTDVFGMTPHSR